MPVVTLPFPAIDPVLIEFGPLAIRWYGLAYFAGILLGWRYARALAANLALWGPTGPAMTPRDIDDFLVWATIGIIGGGRIGYSLFYQPGVYLSDPAALLRVWEGGMSFHGGMLGTIIAMVVFAWSRGFSILSLLDVISTSCTFGLFFGRVANFINGELYGRVTDVPWAMVFPGGGPLPRHPSQLYEALLEGLVLFAILRTLTHRRLSLRYPGLTGSAFIAGYGAARIAVEFFREPDPHIGYLGGFGTMGMVLSVPMVIVGISTAIIFVRRGPRP